MDRINYLNYTVTDFVFDESFREWVLKNNPKKDEFWDNWIARNPGKLKDIQKARELIQAMNEELKEDFSEESARMWRIIDSEIDQLEEKSGLAERNMILHKKQLEQKGKSRSRRRRLAVIGIAASIALLFVTGMYFFNQKGMTIYQTGYGETRRVTLPDNSVVTLNANTILRVPNNWEQLETRKVWIEGEAFFSIVPKGDRQKFLVHSRNVTVDVLGTKFNVNNRREKNQVTLTSGRIELSIKSGKEIKKVIMSPGELVEVSRDQNFEKRKVESEIYTSWRNNRLQFNNTKLSELVIILKENYGLEVILSDDGLRNREFTAVYPADDLGVLFKALAKSFDLKVERRGDTIILRSMPSEKENSED